MNIFYQRTISNTNKYIKNINSEGILNVVKTIKPELDLVVIKFWDSLNLNEN